MTIMHNIVLANPVLGLRPGILEILRGLKGGMVSDCVRVGKPGTGK